MKKLIVIIMLIVYIMPITNISISAAEETEPFAYYMINQEIYEHSDYLNIKYNLIIERMDYSYSKYIAENIDVDGKTVSRKGVSRYIDYDPLTSLAMTIKKEYQPVLDSIEVLKVEQNLDIIFDQLLYKSIVAFNDYTIAYKELEIEELDYDKAIIEYNREIASNELGQLLPHELVLANYKYSLAQSQLLEAELKVENKKNIVNKILELTDNEDYWLEKLLPVDENFIHSIVMLDFNKYIESALINRSDLIILEEELKALMLKKELYDISEALSIYTEAQEEYADILESIKSKQYDIELEKSAIINEVTELYKELLLLIDTYQFKAEFTNIYNNQLMLFGKAFDDGEIESIELKIEAETNNKELESLRYEIQILWFAFDKLINAGMEVTK